MREVYPGPGPSGIKRVSKWKNRRKKAAQHKLNKDATAEYNREICNAASSKRPALRR